MKAVNVFIAAIIFGALGGKKDMLDAIAIMHDSPFYILITWNIMST